MKTNSHRPSVGIACASVLALAMTPWAQAELSAPDNVIYGIIVTGSNQVLATSSAFTIEARNSSGMRIAQYRMGQRSEAGNHYLLQVKVEEMAPRIDLSSVLVNEPLMIAVYSNAVQVAQKTCTVAERGQVLRVDFGSLPTNVWSGFEYWALANGIGANSQALDSDADGISNLGEYIAGTSPTNPANKFLLRIARAPTEARVSFDATKAEGTGYEGRTRHYALQRLTDVRTANWQTLPGYADIPGMNQVVTCQSPVDSGPAFFRGVVWLTLDADQDQFNLIASRNGTQTVISFTALGPDSQGRNRYYTLESATNLNTGPWTAVGGYSNLLGAGQSVTYSVPNASTGRAFYRGRLEVRAP